MKNNALYSPDHIEFSKFLASVPGVGNEHGNKVASLINQCAPASELYAYSEMEERIKNSRSPSKGISQSIRSAINDNVDFINISMGFDYASPDVISALWEAKQKGIVIFLTTGNGSSVNQKLYISASLQSLVVQMAGYLKLVEAYQKESSTGIETISDFSTFPAAYTTLLSNEESIIIKNTIMAPGTQVPTYGVDGMFSISDGTSFAAPIVSGIAAQLKSIFPNLSNFQISEAIFRSARAPNNDPYYDPFAFGRGIINISEAYRACLVLSQAQQNSFSGI